MTSDINQKAAMESEILRGEENAKCAKRMLLQNHAVILASDPTMVNYLDNVIDSFSSLRLINENSPESSRQITADLNPQSKRSAQKRGLERKTHRTRTKIINDGFSWRKYGQKSIKDYRYKRNYFRCATLNHQNCLVTKHEQKIQDSPPVFETTYIGQHIFEAPAFSLNPEASTMIKFESYSQAASVSNLSSLAHSQETIQVEAAASSSNFPLLADRQDAIQLETIQVEAASALGLSSLADCQETLQVEAASGSNFPVLADRRQVTIAACDSDLPLLIDGQERVIQVEAGDRLMADDWLSYLSSYEDTTENDIDNSRF